MGAVVFFDFETGGVEPHHPNIQLAAVAMDGHHEVGAFEAKIQFAVSAADPEALQLNHYTPEAWQGAREEGEVLVGFCEFLRRFADVPMVSKAGRPYKIARLAGHNVAAFDCPRLQAACKRHDLFLPGTVFQPLDTYQRALWWFHENVAAAEQPKNFKLPTLAEYFGLEAGGAHDALVDVRLCAELAQRLRAPAP